MPSATRRTRQEVVRNQLRRDACSAGPCGLELGYGPPGTTHGWPDVPEDIFGPARWWFSSTEGLVLFVDRKDRLVRESRARAMPRLFKNRCKVASCAIPTSAYCRTARRPTVGAYCSIACPRRRSGRMKYGNGGGVVVASYPTQSAQMGVPQGPDSNS